MTSWWLHLAGHHGQSCKPVLQKLQQEAVALAEAKQRGLQQLKHLTGQQLALHSQLHQARQDAEGSTRKLDRLQRENNKLQVRL